MASGRVYKRGDAWYLDYRTGRFVDGKRERIQRRPQGDNKAQAQAELDMLMHDLRRATADGAALDNDFFIQSVAERFIQQKELKRLADKSMKDYRDGFARILKHMAEYRIATVADLTPDVCDEWMLSMQREGLSNGRINKLMGYLDAALQFSEKRCFIRKNPIADMGRLKNIPVKFRRALTRDEAAALLSSAKPERRILWLTLLSTGLRRDEFVNLQGCNLDFESGAIHIKRRAGWEPKTKAGSRVIPMTPKLRDALQPMKGIAQDQTVFVTRIGTPWRNNLLREFRLDMKYAVPTLTKDDMALLDIHALRYTFITELIASGVDPKTVQTLAGHEDITTTLNIYAQCRTDRTADAVTRLPW